MKPEVSPIGTSLSEDILEREAGDAEYRQVQARFARAEAIARLLIQFRMKHGLSQEELASRMGTSAPTISRLESGTHIPSLTTLSRVAEAIGVRLVIGFEEAIPFASDDDRTLVAV